MTKKNSNQTLFPSWVYFICGYTLIAMGVFMALVTLIIVFNDFLLSLIPLIFTTILFFIGNFYIKIAKKISPNKKETSLNDTTQDIDVAVSKETEKSEVKIPSRKDNCPIAYKYSMVALIDTDYEKAMELASANQWELSVSDNYVLSGIGKIGDEKVSSMLSDWIKNKEPFGIYLEDINTETKEIAVYVVFYRDKRISMNWREQTTVKLSSCFSKEKQFYIMSMENGDVFELAEDIDNPNTINVEEGNLIVGRIPSKAAKRFIAEGAAGCFFDHNDYDDEKDKYIPYVTIYW